MSAEGRARAAPRCAGAATSLQVPLQWDTAPSPGGLERAGWRWRTEQRVEDRDTGHGDKAPGDSRSGHMSVCPLPSIRTYILRTSHTFSSFITTVRLFVIEGFGFLKVGPILGSSPLCGTSQQPLREHDVLPNTMGPPRGGATPESPSPAGLTENHTHTDPVSQR